MKKNLTARTVVIVVTILICVLGIVDFPKSAADLKKNIGNNIRLGLDLKGGTHLVMQVQVQDAVKADAEQTAERLKEDLKKLNVTWAGTDVNEVGRVEDAGKIALTIKGIPITQTSAFRNVRQIRWLALGWALGASLSSAWALKQFAGKYIAAQQAHQEIDFRLGPAPVFE